MEVTTVTKAVEWVDEHECSSQELMVTNVVVSEVVCFGASELKVPVEADEPMDWVVEDFIPVDVVPEVAPDDVELEPVTFVESDFGADELSVEVNGQ